MSEDKFKFVLSFIGNAKQEGEICEELYQAIKKEMLPFAGERPGNLLIVSMVGFQTAINSFRTFVKLNGPTKVNKELDKVFYDMMEEVNKVVKEICNYQQGEIKKQVENN